MKRAWIALPALTCMYCLPWWYGPARHDAAPSAIQIGSALSVVAPNSGTEAPVVPPAPGSGAAPEPPAPPAGPPKNAVQCDPSMGPDCLIIEPNEDGSLTLPGWLEHFNDGEAP